MLEGALNGLPHCVWLQAVCRAVKHWLTGLVYALCLGSAPFAHAADARAQLQQFVTLVSSASGIFQQNQAQAAGPVQSGVFSFQRPGKFRWEVQQPYAQLVLSDGVQVFQYDPDLNQVTQRRLGAALGSSPAAILFGSGVFEQVFALAVLPDAEGLAWLRAQPREPDAGFVHADIGWRDGLPVRLRLLDAFGQTTQIAFSDMQVNIAFAPDTFTFQAPDGVDMVRMP